MTTDRGIHEHIDELISEEKALRGQLSAHEISPEEERARLHAVEVQLDQAWDLLRQREALRRAGADADTAAERSPDTVEGYLG